jgi:uncharacterized protein
MAALEMAASPWRRRALAAGVLFATAAGMGAAVAQPVISTARPAPPEAAAMNAPITDGPAVRIDPEALRLARRVYDLIGAQAMATTVRSMTTAMSLQFATAMDDRHEERAKAIVAAVGDGMNSIMPQITDASVSAIARDFTLAQLRDILAFYESPTGQVALRRLPAIQRQSTSVMVQYLPQMMAGVEDSFCSRVRCSAKEHKALQAVATRLEAAHPPG